jgi:hypothetical protein
MYSENCMTEKSLTTVEMSLFLFLSYRVLKSILLKNHTWIRISNFEIRIQQKLTDTFWIQIRRTDISNKISVGMHVYGVPEGKRYPIYA